MPLVMTAGWFVWPALSDSFKNDVLFGEIPRFFTRIATGNQNYGEARVCVAVWWLGGLVAWWW